MNCAHGRTDGAYCVHCNAAPSAEFPPINPDDYRRPHELYGCPPDCPEHPAPSVDNRLCPKCGYRSLCDCHGCYCGFNPAPSHEAGLSPESRALLHEGIAQAKAGLTKPMPSAGLMDTVKDSPADVSFRTALLERNDVCLALAAELEAERQRAERYRAALRAVFTDGCGPCSDVVAKALADEPVRMEETCPTCGGRWGRCGCDEFKKDKPTRMVERSPSHAWEVAVWGYACWQCGQKHLGDNPPNDVCHGKPVSATEPREK